MAITGLSSESQADYNPIWFDWIKGEDITILSGQASCGLGQALIYEKSSGKYKLMGAFTDVTAKALSSVAVEDGAHVAVIYCNASSVPVLPSSMTIYMTLGGTASTITDDGEGGLTESGNKANGGMDYSTGRLTVNSYKALASTDMATGSWTYIASCGSGMDLSRIAISPGTTDASSADKYARVMTKGRVDYARITPTIKLTTNAQFKLFEKAGIYLDSKTARS